MSPQDAVKSAWCFFAWLYWVLVVHVLYSGVEVARHLYLSHDPEHVQSHAVAGVVGWVLACLLEPLKRGLRAAVDDEGVE